MSITVVLRKLGQASPR